LQRTKLGGTPSTIWIALDHFIAGVPPLGYFELEVEHLVTLVNSSKEDKISPLNFTAEVCLIGLSAYFEAFCKSHFAALVNICPEILNNFVERRQNAALNLSHILHLRDHIERKLGNLISEEHDFGSAKEINKLYNDLLRITPFSTKEVNEYAKFLGDRNLLVHHGGVYTFRYSTQRFARRVAPGVAHMDSLVVGKKKFSRWESFLTGMANKIADTSRLALQEFIIRHKVKMRPEQAKAIAMLGSSKK
jgi:hypothetical protein